MTKLDVEIDSAISLRYVPAIRAKAIRDDVEEPK